MKIPVSISNSPDFQQKGLLIPRYPLWLTRRLSAAGRLSKFGKHYFLAKFVSIASATEQGIQMRISTDTEVATFLKL